MKPYLEACDEGYIVTDLPGGRAQVVRLPAGSARWPRVTGDPVIEDVEPTRRRGTPIRTAVAVMLLARWIAHQRDVKTSATVAHGVVRRLLGTMLDREEAQVSMMRDPHPLLGQRVYTRDALAAIDANIESGTRGSIVHGGIVLVAEDLPEGFDLLVANQSRPRTAGAKGGVLIERHAAWLVHRCDPGCSYCPRPDEVAARALWHRLHLAFVEDVGQRNDVRPQHCIWIHAADALTLAMTGELPC